MKNTCDDCGWIVSQYDYTYDDRSFIIDENAIESLYGYAWDEVLMEVLMELNINGIMDTAYSYGNGRLTNERFTEWTGYYTYDPRGSVAGVTDSNGMIWQSYRYSANGDVTFGKPQYNNVYSYNAESCNSNMES